MDTRYMIQRVVNRLGYQVERAIPSDLDPVTTETIRRVFPFTKTTPAAIGALCSATAYIVKAGIPGAFVECGVWQGGSMMAAARTLGQLGARDRALWLYDTFSGMAVPGEVDVRSWDGALALELDTRLGDGSSKWANADLKLVQTNMGSTGYPADLVRYIPGLVENTIPATAPDEIALLRLDTDFYDSTRHELEHLFPRLSRGGVLIVDDYGGWLGVRKAVDEYMEKEGFLYLSRIDHSVRLAVKV
jgi:O-methyltransferase